jgi:ribose transport system substrate-binding protein
MKPRSSIFTCLFHTALVALAAILAVPSGAFAQQGFDDGMSAFTRDALKGKTVAFQPLGMSFDIPQALDAELKRHAARWGYKYVMRDAAFSVERAVQAVDQLIAEKPDVLIVFPWDASAFNRLVKKANDAGITWVWIIQKSAVNGDAFVGSNFYEYGQAMTREADKECGPSSSGKLAIIQTPPNNPSSLFYTNGIVDEVAKHPHLSIVSTQSAGVDANKAKSIAETVIKQHPDLCAFMGLWDGNDLGIISAVQEAGMKGKIHIISTGSGNQTNGCDKVADGSYDAYASYNIATSSRLLTRAVEELLQTRPTPGKTKYAFYVDPEMLTKDTLKPNSCWKLEDFQKPLN